MTRTYKQLTLEERYHIQALWKAGRGLQAIAAEIGRAPSTVLRELRRNTGERGYRGGQAHGKALERREGALKSKKFTSEVCAVVEAKLALEWSPDQISGWMKREYGADVAVSHERIYQHVIADQKSGGTLYQRLRRGHRKYRRRTKKLDDRRGRCRNRRDISERPAVVERRSRVGDWEGDTVLGPSKRDGGLVSLVERRSQFVVLAKVHNLKADTVTDAICTHMKGAKGIVHTVTFDNGKEFFGHETIARKLGADVFFATPYHAWERGTNEQVNGLVRQYIRKGTSMRTVTEDKTFHIMQRLNHRPRKKLGYMTPFEFLSKEVGITYTT